MKNGMENANISHKIIEGIPDTETYKKLESLYTTIFEDADPVFFKNRVQEQEKLVSVLAFYEEKLVGFKIGYLYNQHTFYNWVGGVLLSFRQKGVAKQLAILQETLAKERGYTKLRTKSMNRFKPMMILNLKNGFNIVQVYTNNIGQTKVVFEKNLY